MKIVFSKVAIIDVLLSKITQYFILRRGYGLPEG
jgi:hypothetical protein